MLLLDCYDCRGANEGQDEVKKLKQPTFVLYGVGTEMFSLLFKIRATQSKLRYCAASDCAFGTLGMEVWLNRRAQIDGGRTSSHSFT